MRFRITFGFVAGGLVVSLFVGASTYALARTYLIRQRTESAIRQSYNSLRFATEFLSRPEEVHRPERLVSFLQTRGTSEILVKAGRRTVSSSVSLAIETIPSELVGLVDSGNVAYTIVGGAPRRLAFGSAIPGTEWNVYLVYGMRDLDTTLGLLARILIATAASAAAVSAILGWRIALRTIEPLRRASEAAQRVAEGLTDTRLEVQTADELGVMAASFNEMAAALQERISRERRFVADASHELRTPLTGLKTSVDFLNDHPEKLPAPLRSIASLASEEVRSLQRLVDDLLELSRVESGSVEVLSEDVDLRAFAEEVARRRAPSVPVTVTADAALRVRTDKARLERVVGNFVENAVVHGGGADVRIQVLGEGDDAEIIVSDAGPGMGAEQQTRIFERFWRADQARRRAAGSGAGLGLAIARESAQLLGGVIRVDSSPGAGARFILRLPGALVRDEGTPVERAPR